MILLIRPSFFKMLKLVSFLALLGVMVCPLWAGKEGGGFSQIEGPDKKVTQKMKIGRGGAKKNLEDFKKNIAAAGPYRSLKKNYNFNLSQNQGMYKTFPTTTRKDEKPMEQKDYEFIVRTFMSIKDSELNEHAQKMKKNLLNVLQEKMDAFPSSASQSAPLPSIANNNPGESHHGKAKNNRIWEHEAFEDLDKTYDVFSLKRRDETLMTLKDYNEIKSKLQINLAHLRKHDSEIRNDIIKKVENEINKIKKSAYAPIFLHEQPRGNMEWKNFINSRDSCSPHKLNWQQFIQGPLPPLNKTLKDILKQVP